MRVILASKSPRRQALLTKVFPNFDIIEADIDETIDDRTAPEIQVMTLALRKAQHVYDGIIDKQGILVIGSDTLCFMQGKRYGKPKDYADAVRMLTEFSGKTHYVFSAVALVSSAEARVFYDVSEVHFLRLTDEDIKTYLDKFPPLDKAGSYGIQDNMVVAGYTGSFDNIMGLPTEKLTKEMESYAKV